MKITAKVQQVFPVEAFPTRAGGQFQKRVVWAVDESNSQYPNPLEFEFTGQAISTPDRLQPGMQVEFECAIQGNEWSKDGRTARSIRLRAWGAQVLGMAQQPYNPQHPQPVQYAPQQPAYPQPQPGGGHPQNVQANPYGGNQVAATGYGQPQPVQYQQQPQPAPGFVPPLPIANPQGGQPTYGPNDLPF